MVPVPRRLFLILASLGGLVSASLRADAPSMLATALQRWSAEQGELAFTQQTRGFLPDGRVKEERIERYDPSLPDSRRWRLIEVNGVPATDEQRRKWESRKNGKPRRKVDKSPLDYLDLDHAGLIGETPKDARYRIPIRPEAQHLVSLNEIDLVITVDKQSGNVAGIGAALREPIRVLLGLARITDLDVDIRIRPVDEASPNVTDDVESDSTARVKISRLGTPVEYNWSDFKRVTPFASGL
jgi:hypothetical protein